MNNPFPLVVANHKANKTWDEVKAWLDEVGPEAKDFKGTIVFCPSFPFLVASYDLITSKKYNLKLGSQDISFFDQGPYTGEVAATQLTGIVGYALVGHSERRQNFNEDAARLQNKLVNAQKADISAILCLQSENTPILNDVAIVAYEPTFAIGSGNPDTLTNIELVAKRIKEKGPYRVLYGGSVSKDNVGGIMLLGVIDGVLVGASHSLDPQKFTDILKAIH